MQTRPALVRARSALDRLRRLLLAGRAGVGVRGAGALHALGLGLALLQRREGAILRAALGGQAELAAAGGGGVRGGGRLRVLRIGDADAGDERRSGGESGESLHAMPPRALIVSTAIERHGDNGAAGTGFRARRIICRMGDLSATARLYPICPGSRRRRRGSA